MEMSLDEGLPSRIILSTPGGDEKVSANPSKSLLEQRAELERQLRELTERDNVLYTPGRTVVSDQARSIDEQTNLQIEELQAAIAQIDEALKNVRGS